MKNYLYLILLLSLMLFIAAIVKEAQLCKNPKIGFFSPERIDHRFVPKVNFSMRNLYLTNDLESNSLRVDLDSLKLDLSYVSHYEHIIHLDLGAVITDTIPPENLNILYVNSKNQQQKKIFSPMTKNAMRKIASDEEIKRRLSGLPALVSLYRSNIGTIFLVDEPYLHGISRNEINRAVRALKKIFNKAGLNDLEYGIISASGLFDADFAKHINQNMSKYVEGIDSYYQKNFHLLQENGPEADEFKTWVNTIIQHRLTTYDSANNIYIEGGIPEELDIIAFDFYLSTLLLDQIHEYTLHYFGTLGIDSCSPFIGTTISSIRKKLSFFQDGPVTQQKKAHEKRPITSRRHL